MRVLHQLALIIVIVVHFILCAAFATAFFCLPFSTEWYVAVPIMSFQVFFVTNRFRCIITDAENYLRAKLGMRKIGGFVGHYCYKPLKKLVLPQKSFLETE